MKIIRKVLLLTLIFVIFQVQNAFSYADILSLTASSGSYSDETIIRFYEEATCEFDGDWDAYKLSNGGNTPNFYSQLNAKRYAINSVPEEFETFSVDLNLKVAFDGNYTISTKAINNTYNSSLTVTLEDKLLNTNQVLEENSTYTFSATSNDLPGRFALHFNKSTAREDLISGFNSKIEENKVIVDINSGYAFISFQNIHSEDAVITLLSSDGKVIYNNENTSTGSTTEILLNGNNSGTIYILTVIVDNTVITKKLYN